jgi:large subunit ribosomal protein L21
MSYAIITVGGKQYRVQEGERLLVDRLKTDEGTTFTPRVLLIGGDGTTDLSPSTTVTAREVVSHELGEKIRIGNYKRALSATRSHGTGRGLTQIEIEAIGAGSRKAARRSRPKPRSGNRSRSRPRRRFRGSGSGALAASAEGLRG